MAWKIWSHHASNGFKINECEKCVYVKSTNDSHVIVNWWMKRTCLMKETQPLEGTQHLVWKDINRRLPSLNHLRVVSWKTYIIYYCNQEQGAKILSLGRCNLQASKQAKLFLLPFEFFLFLLLNYYRFVLSSPQQSLVCFRYKLNNDYV